MFSYSFTLGIKIIRDSNFAVDLWFCYPFFFFAAFSFWLDWMRRFLVYFSCLWSAYLVNILCKYSRSLLLNTMCFLVARLLGLWVGLFFPQRQWINKVPKSCLLWFCCNLGFYLMETYWLGYAWLGYKLKTIYNETSDYLLIFSPSQKR